MPSESDKKDNGLISKTRNVEVDAGLVRNEQSAVTTKQNVDSGKYISEEGVRPGAYATRIRWGEREDVRREKAFQSLQLIMGVMMIFHHTTGRTLRSTDDVESSSHSFFQRNVRRKLEIFLLYIYIFFSTV